MRIGLVSPYSWTYPGGVTRHIEALATQLFAAGHDVRVLAPFDPDARRTAVLHRGVRPQRRELPEWLSPLGGTMGWPSNGAVSNVALTPASHSALRRELRAHRFDVLHLHEPVAPIACWDALTSADAPLVGTFHCYSEARLIHKGAAFVGARRVLNRLAVRIAVSEAAAWTGRRFYGGRYRIVPNGVELPPDGVPAPRLRADGEPLRIAFVGQAVERKGLPVLLRAFEALRHEVPAELTIVGATPDEVEPLLVEHAGVNALGRVDDATRHEVLVGSDLLCAPSLRGESFGMVLTEAFAAGTPVVASDIAGYSDVVGNGVDGVLFPRGDATRLAEVLRDLALDTPRLRALGSAAGQSAERYAWPRVTEEIVAAYEDAVAVPAPEKSARRVGIRMGALPADGGPRAPARRLPRLDPAPRRLEGHNRRLLRRAGAVTGAAAVGAACYYALQRIGLKPIAHALVHSSPSWVLLGLAVMCLAMFMRAVSWSAILKAAVPEARPTFTDALQGTAIGVLMSATLPARLGELSRALIVARRLGRARERLPVVIGTLVSQTLLNVLALAMLGTIMFTTVGLFAGRQQALLWYALAPIAALVAMLLVPVLLHRGNTARSSTVYRWLGMVRDALARVRSGLVVYRHTHLGIVAALGQLAAWALQMASCYVLLVALGLDSQAGIGAAAAVLFAVNVTAVLPVTPSNLGVFQAACVAVLSGAYGIGAGDALGYGIILQAVEVATAVIMGAPALVKEGLSWREVRLRALHTAPVSLSSRQSSSGPAREPA